MPRNGLRLSRKVIALLFVLWALILIAVVIPLTFSSGFTVRSLKIVAAVGIGLPGALLLAAYLLKDPQALLVERALRSRLVATPLPSGSTPYFSFLPVAAVLLVAGSSRVDPLVAYAVRHSLVVRPIFFCTDRKPNAGGYSEADSRDLSYGTLEALIEWNHNVADLPDTQTLVWRGWGDPPKFRNLHPLSQQAFFQQVKQAVQASPARDAFLFVHGFRVPFDDAVATAGAMDFDLKFAGAAILFSWPSADEGYLRVSGNYNRDSQKARLAVLDLGGILPALRIASGAQRFDIFAHSMGTYVAGTSIYDAAPQLSAPGRKLDHIVFGAPDMEPEYLARLADRLPKVAAMMTVYTSSADIALRLSAVKQQDQRAGSSAAPLPNLEIVDATGMDATLLGHSYMFQGRVLSDIFQIVHSNTKGPDRFDLWQGKDGILHFKERKAETKNPWWWWPFG